MSELIKVIILILLVLISIIIDVNTTYKNCIEDKFYDIFPIIFIHRVVCIFMYFGWIFNDKNVLIIYIVFMVGILIHWYTNKWKCFLTEQESEICNFHRGRYYDPIFKNLGPTAATIIANILKALIYCIVIYKIFKKA
jgi:hypothetical protein